MENGYAQQAFWLICRQPSAALWYNARAGKRFFRQASEQYSFRRKTVFAALASSDLCVNY